MDKNIIKNNDNEAAVREFIMPTLDKDYSCKTKVLKEAIHKYHMNIQVKLLQDMVDVLTDIERSEEERISYCEAMSEALYVMTLMEDKVNG